MLRNRRQQLDEMSNSLAIGLRLRLAMAAPAHHRSKRARRLLRSSHAAPQVLRRRIEQRCDALTGAMDRLLARKRREYATVEVQLAALDLRARVARLRAQSERCTAELAVRIDRLLVARRRKLESAMMQLDERSPLNILKRGFAIAYDASGKVLRSIDQVAIGDEIAVRLEKGQLAATVRTKK